MIVLVVSIVGLILAMGKGDKLKKTFLEGGFLKDEEIEDPFANKATNGVVARWESDGQGGLTIGVLNALSSDWEVFFNLAVADWEYGNPDALSLQVEAVDEDKACKPVVGTVHELMTMYVNPSRHLTLCRFLRQDKGLQ
jgi:hypothetical protein